MRAQVSAAVRLQLSQPHLSRLAPSHITYIKRWVSALSPAVEASSGSLAHSSRNGFLHRLVNPPLMIYLRVPNDDWRHLAVVWLWVLWDSLQEFTHNFSLMYFICPCQHWRNTFRYLFTASEQALSYPTLFLWCFQDVQYWLPSAPISQYPGLIWGFPLKIMFPNSYLVLVSETTESSFRQFVFISFNVAKND
jgi:hypothetical protein